MPIMSNRDAGVPVVLGGPHVSALPDEALESCDAVVVGHGESTWLDLLADREIEVFQLIGGGLNSREIAGRLTLAPSTVDSYRARIKEKLGIKNAAQLYQRAAQWVAESSL